MKRLTLIKHAPGAPGLRILGLGPNLLPSEGLSKLKSFLEQHAFWASNRNLKDLRQVLSGSSAVITLWRGKRLIGFGRATSDGIYRAVLWDVVIANDSQGQGLGRQIVEALLATPPLRKVEKVYLMTTNCTAFYKQLGFESCPDQSLLRRIKSIKN